MKHLLDVNALIAWEHPRSPHHVAFHTWAKKQDVKHCATCALAELGFLRVSMQAFGYSGEDAKRALVTIKAQLGGYIQAAPSPVLLADWATTAAKTSDAYLSQVATAEGLKLATFDKGIPGALVIA